MAAEIAKNDVVDVEIPWAGTVAVVLLAYEIKIYLDRGRWALKGKAH